jgi:hypothetical protein
MLAAWIIILMMKSASTSETSVNLYKTTWHSNPEDSHLEHITYISRSVQCVLRGLFISGRKENILKYMRLEGLETAAPFTRICPAQPMNGPVKSEGRLSVIVFWISVSPPQN